MDLDQWLGHFPVQHDLNVNDIHKRILIYKDLSSRSCTFTRSTGGGESRPPRFAFSNCQQAFCQSCIGSIVYEARFHCFTCRFSIEGHCWKSLGLPWLRNTTLPLQNVASFYFSILRTALRLQALRSFPGFVDSPRNCENLWRHVLPSSRDRSKPRFQF